MIRYSIDTSNMKRLNLILLMFLCLSAGSVNAQSWSISTNLIDYACLGTMNVESSYAVSQHWSISASAKYNPFTFHKGERGKQFQYRQQSYAVGTRFWPWHTFSGWWLSGKIRYQEYNGGGIISPETEEGDKVGLGLAAGYTYMISKHFNVELGLGAWGGRAWYKKYACPKCGLTIEDGKKWFLFPDDFIISFAYVF